MSSEGGTDSRPGRIVVGVDGSPPSAQALRWAVRLARATGDTVHAVMAWNPPSVHALGPGLPDDVDLAKGCAAALELTIKETLDGPDADKVQRHAVPGHPAQALIDEADGAELLVVGRRGHGGFTGMLLGSVSQHVISHAPCPVVVVHDEPEHP